MRSGSNEVFLRTSFQYSKANLRKQLLSYFEEHELGPFDLKARKKKDLWVRLIKEKKQRLFLVFAQKKMTLNKDDANSISCSNTDSSVTCPLPPIDWNETSANHHRYIQNQALNLCAPYPTDSISMCTYNVAPSPTVITQRTYYGNHRQCTDCNVYIRRVNELIHANNQLMNENKYLRQLNQQYIVERGQCNYNGTWSGPHFQSI